ncbi:DUF697 domain-containing protein [Pseudodesulfovibrio sediminis]|uniref:DUF697 domain-containing protein n=1 Tax=Pseudodesulfovibrio sediminis TaxID=2810563 RepID=A0ABN6EWU1_9BACT|nr:DUF697 domain-containing protein [Pseudodesulfovibrio sediminis]BCS89529.1 hypothetical protein PSDVSF_27710 [Pseudodesulfovibrio sediminis]
MSRAMKNFLTIAGVVIIGAFLAFLYDCVVGLSDFAGRIHPELPSFVFWILFTLVFGTLGWLVAVALVRPRPIMVHADPTEEELRQFRSQLMKRLSRNRILKDNGVVVNDETGMEVGLNVLRSRADEEIRTTAKRVFVGTAISQNGRLDALVVLFLIARLVWRISKLYNQRPHSRELINLYANIAITAFLAGSIDEFGIEEYVHELMGPLVATSAIGAMPGAEAVAGTVTASILSGSTNSLLATRCGIVARNYMSLELDTRGRMRRSATLEAAKMFVSVSGESITRVTKLLLKGSSGAVKNGAKKAAKSMGKTFTGAAGNVGTGARTVGRGVKDSAKSMGREVKDSAKAMGREVRYSARTVVDGVDKVVDKTADGIKRSARKVEETVKEVSREISPAVGKAEAAVARAGGFFSKAGKSVEKRVRKTRDAVLRKKKGSDGKEG